MTFNHNTEWEDSEIPAVPIEETEEVEEEIELIQLKEEIKITLIKEEESEAEVSISRIMYYWSSVD